MMIERDNVLTVIESNGTLIAGEYAPREVLQEQGPSVEESYWFALKNWKFKDGYLEGGVGEVCSEIHFRT
jgi:hypothetical protein